MRPQSKYKTTRDPIRAAALAAGQVTYVNGAVCSRGHVAPRYSLTGLCKVCNAAKSLRSHHNVNGFPAPTRPKPNACENCKQPPRAKGLALDHNHETGAFRGWLCSPCNTAIGALGDTVEALEQATDYLRRNT